MERHVVGKDMKWEDTRQMDQCVHPLPLSGSCDQHRDKRRLGHCSTHQVRGCVFGGYK